MTRKFTRWYPANILPVRRGWYLRDFSEIYPIGGYWFSYWDNKMWSVSIDCVPGKDFLKLPIAPNQKLKWRGVTK